MTRTNPAPKPKGHIDLEDARVSYVMRGDDVVLNYAEVVQLPRGDSLGVLFATHPTVRGHLECPVYEDDGVGRLGITLRSFRELLVRVREWSIRGGNGDRRVSRWAAGVLDALNTESDHQVDEAMRGRR